MWRSWHFQTAPNAPRWFERKRSILQSLSSKILSEVDNEEWYDSDLWEKWHKMSYTELLETTTLDDTLYNVYRKNVLQLSALPHIHRKK